MKWIMLLLVNSFLYISAANAQTLDEWLNQGATQKKYLLQQIAALQVYLGYLRKGYDMVHKGLAVISDIKQGDLDIHTGYFNSLSTVNPAIGRYARIADIITLQSNIVKVCNNTKRSVRESGLMSNDEASYIDKVFAGLLGSCAQDIDELISVTTNGKLEMKDDERLERIDKIYADMTDKYVFARHFSKGTALLSMQRLKEQHDIENTQLLYYIKK